MLAAKGECQLLCFLELRDEKDFAVIKSDLAGRTLKKNASAKNIALGEKARTMGYRKIVSGWCHKSWRTTGRS